jgi:hypothetical protein
LKVTLRVQLAEAASDVPQGVPPPAVTV